MLKRRVLSVQFVLWGMFSLWTGWWLIQNLTPWGVLGQSMWMLVVAAVLLSKSKPEPLPAFQNQSDLCEAAVQGWARALQMGNPAALEHSQRTMLLAEWLGRELRLNDADLQYLRWGALLHDIGKLAIPHNILEKPMHLSEEEFLVMQKHTEYGLTWMETLEFLGPAREVIHCHHEKWDGSGYPLKLKHKDIPYLARIFTLVDVYDALTSHRPYRAALPQDEALHIIRERVGSHFDPEIAGVFLSKIKLHEPAIQARADVLQ